MELSKSNFNFEEYASKRRLTIESKLQEFMQIREPKLLWQSMAYSVLSGGKRLRALLCIAAAELCAGATDTDKNEALQAVLPCACSIELIHAMSLIHDDLPALDNDDLRRGKATNHKVFGEALALLAGDALLMLATELLIEKTSESVPRNKLLSVALELCRATGASGMVGGQVDDLGYTGHHLDSPLKSPSVSYNGDSADSLNSLNSLDSLGYVDKNKNYTGEVDESILASIHKRKTGALIRFAAWSGALIGGGSKSQIKIISEFAETLGLAFQIADDILDTTGNSSTLGKTPGKDEASKKATWVRVFGKEKSEQTLKALEISGRELILNGGFDSSSSEALVSLLSYAVHRTH